MSFGISQETYMLQISDLNLVISIFNKSKFCFHTLLIMCQSTVKAMIRQKRVNEGVTSES